MCKTTEYLCLKEGIKHLICIYPGQACSSQNRLAISGYLSNKSSFQKIFQGEMLFKTQPTSLLLIQVNVDMTDHNGFLHMKDDMLGPSRCISSIRHMYTTDFAYDGPIFLVPLSPSYPSSPVSCKFMTYFKNYFQKYQWFR